MKAASTHNPTFSGRFSLANFGRPFMVADASTGDGGNGEKWDEAAIPIRERQRQCLPDAVMVNSAYGPLK
jgi:hypothetical protein